MPKKHIPNVLTLFRIGMIPLLLMVYLTLPGTYWPFALYFLVSITDYFDGYLARLWKVESKFGAFLDPAADKVLVCSLLVVLVAEQATLFFTLPALIIIFRELLISMLREYLARIARSDVLDVDQFGKYKTAFQMLCLGFFLLPESHYTLALAYLFFYMSCALTILSLYRYLMKIKTALRPSSFITHAP